MVIHDGHDDQHPEPCDDEGDAGEPHQGCIEDVGGYSFPKAVGVGSYSLSSSSRGSFHPVRSSPQGHPRLGET